MKTPNTKGDELSEFEGFRNGYLACEKHYHKFGKVSCYGMLKDFVHLLEPTLVNKLDYVLGWASKLRKLEGPIYR